LQFAQRDQVFDTLCRRLHVAVEHRGVAVDAELMRRAVDVEPAVGPDLALEDFIVHAIVEDLRAAAGERARPASRNAVSTSRTLMRATREKWTISIAVNALMCRFGRDVRMPRSRSR
jgi:hypothetical protein